MPAPYSRRTCPHDWARGLTATLEGSDLHKSPGLRSSVAVLLAIILHGLIVMALVSTRDEPAPQEAVFDVVLAPAWPLKTPPTTEPKPATPRLGEHASEQARKSVGPAAPITPGAGQISGAWQVREGATPETEGVRGSLRAGVGCRSADFLSLTKAERDACNEKLAAGAKDGPAYAVVSPKLKKQFDGVFECPKDDVWCEYRIGKAPYPGLLAPRRKKSPDWD